MSVLIKGMKMPNWCNRCQFLDDINGLCRAAGKYLDDDYFDWFCVEDEDYIDTRKPLNCPLVEVPVPHGRLIDADKLSNKGWVLHKMKGSTLHEMPLKHPSIPVVIEAEEKR